MKLVNSNSTLTEQPFKSVCKKIGHDCNYDKQSIHYSSDQTVWITNEEGRNRRALVCQQAVNKSSGCALCCRHFSECLCVGLDNVFFVMKQKFSKAAGKGNKGIATLPTAAVFTDSPRARSIGHKHTTVCTTQTTSRKEKNMDDAKRL